jgi:hypothetical protein
MIYPNPVSDKLRVRAKNNISEIRITDVSGRTLLRKRIESNQAELEINSLKEGVYLIQILDNRDNYSVRKIIKH